MENNSIFMNVKEFIVQYFSIRCFNFALNLFQSLKNVICSEFKLTNVIKRQIYFECFAFSLKIQEIVFYKHFYSYENEAKSYTISKALEVYKSNFPFLFCRDSDLSFFSNNYINRLEEYNDIIRNSKKFILHDIDFSADKNDNHFLNCIYIFLKFISFEILDNIAYPKKDYLKTGFIRDFMENIKFISIRNFVFKFVIQFCDETTEKLAEVRRK